MSVGSALEAHQPEVVELQQPMTNAMEQLQAAIVEVMDACLQELKRTNQVQDLSVLSAIRMKALTPRIQLDVEELTVENGLFKSFDTIIKRQLETIWHQVGPKTKQLIADLRTLRNLLTYLVSYDCVTYNRYLETLRTHEFGQYSIWLFLPAANRIFSVPHNHLFAVCALCL
jgi:DNA excision repair protein ERCC-4